MLTLLRWWLILNWECCDWFAAPQSSLQPYWLYALLWGKSTCSALFQQHKHSGSNVFRDTNTVARFKCFWSEKRVITRTMLMLSITYFKWYEPSNFYFEKWHDLLPNHELQNIIRTVTPMTSWCWLKQSGFWPFETKKFLLSKHEQTKIDVSWQVRSYKICQHFTLWRGYPWWSWNFNNYKFGQSVLASNPSNAFPANLSYNFYLVHASFIR